MTGNSLNQCLSVKTSKSKHKTLGNNKLNIAMRKIIVTHDTCQQNCEI